MAKKKKIQQLQQMFEVVWNRKTNRIDRVLTIDNPETIVKATQPTNEVAYVQVLNGMIVAAFLEDEIVIADICYLPPVRTGLRGALTVA